jgi:hypothetical protein
MPLELSSLTAGFSRSSHEVIALLRKNAQRLLSLLIFTSAATAAELPADHAEKMARGLEMFRKEVGPLLREH